MEKDQTFYCWIGAFEAGDDVLVNLGWTPPADGVLVIMRGDRPPSKSSATKAPDFHFDEWWVADKAYDLPDASPYVLRMGAAFTKLDEAEAWTKNGVGKKWADRAMVCSLTTFQVKVNC
jgi:hypothetical protein